MRLFAGVCFILALAVAVHAAEALPEGVDPSGELLQLGLLDVTKAPYSADPTGGVDCTEAIQRAVNDARDNDLVCYFPSGTYLVSDAILGMRKTIPAGNGWRTDNHQCILVGSAIDRPVIKLAQNAPKFQDPDNPLPVLWLYSMSAYGQQADCEGSTDPECGQSNINFNQMVKSIDIDLSGNPGAVGIRHAGAQGATIEDVKVNATGAFAGIYNPPGQAGGTYNVEVEGGQYGCYIAKVKGRHQSRHNMISGCVFKNQETAVFHFEVYTPAVIVGFHIVKDEGPINTTLPEFDGLSLVDGVIELGGGKVINNENIEGGQSNVYFRNVYLKGAEEILEGSPVPLPQAWTHITEYSYCEDAGSSNLVDGDLNKQEYFTKTDDVDIDGDEMARALIMQHVWENDTYPTFETPGIVNVKDPGQMNGSPAIGDGQTDDTDALEYAIANYENVFLPKGQYAISRTLTLGRNTQLFGVGRTLSTITAAAEWTGGANDPLIDTVDDPDATTSMSHLAVRARGRSGSHGLSWRAGQQSRVRSVSARDTTIHGSGGGRWMGLFNVGAQTRILGTTQPLFMYSANPERAANPQLEISNAQNVRIYIVKSEAGITEQGGNIIQPSIPLRIVNSRNISVFGGTGNISLQGTDHGMIEVEGSDDILVTHVRPWKPSEGWYVIRETYEGEVYGVPATDKLALFKRGNPTPELPVAE